MKKTIALLTPLILSGAAAYANPIIEQSGTNTIITCSNLNKDVFKITYNFRVEKQDISAKCSCNEIDVIIKQNFSIYPKHNNYFFSKISEEYNRYEGVKYKGIETTTRGNKVNIITKFELSKKGKLLNQTIYNNNKSYMRTSKNFNQFLVTKKDLTNNDRLYESVEMIEGKRANQILNWFNEIKKDINYRKKQL
ncbi:hypothetical protein ACFL1H_02340 [Nanoarchaeota archaeon]